jgi:hypothetical protein
MAHGVTISGFHYQVLGQVAPSATTETDLYVVPADHSAVISSLVVCNRGATAATFRISVSVAGAATSNKDYLYYDLLIPPNETFVFTGGITMDETDEMRVYASTGNFSFSLFGQENDIA